MPDVATIQAEIRARLAQVQDLMASLRREADQLTKIAATFNTERTSASPPASPATRRRTPRKASPRPAPPTSTPRAQRGRPPTSGSRTQEALAKITAKPGITVGELAKAMEIGPNYLYRVLPQIEKDAKITKQGKGYYPAGQTEPDASGSPNRPSSPGNAS